MFRTITAVSLLLLASGLVFPSTSCFAQADEAAPAEPSDRYAVPEGDVSELVKFIEELKGYEPDSSEDRQEYLIKAPLALNSAAEKILQLEEDKSSPAYQLATRVRLEQRVRLLPRSTPQEQAATLDETFEFVAGQEQLDTNDLQLAVAIPQLLDMVGNKELAATAYTRFGELFANSDNEGIVGLSQQLLAAARRLTLVGNEMELTGATLSGEPFDLHQWKGKVVLVDFWATWCGPCVAEIPNVKSLYDKYHDQGFEVVGISLDQNRVILERFVQDRDLPWTILHDESSGGQHPAAEHYGIMAIPAMFLVGRDGKVLSLNARGDELERLLEDQFGSGAGAAP